MNIIFQSGEFLCETNSILTTTLNILGALVGAGISGGIAIWIFNRGLKKEKETDIEKEFKELNGYKNFIQSSINSCINPMIRQATVIDKLIDVLKNEKILDYTYYIVTSLVFNWYDELDKLRIFKIFSTLKNVDDKSKAFYNSKFNSIIEHTKAIIIHSKNIFDLMSKGLLEHESGFNKSKDIIFNLHDEINEKIINKSNLTEFEDDLMKSSEDFYKITDTTLRNDMFVTYNSLILPLEKLIYKYQNKNLIICYRHCDFHFKNYKKIKDSYINSLSDCSISLKMNAKKLSVILRKLDKGIEI